MSNALAPVAAIDCGTNSTRLLVVDAGGVAVEREMRITRLGQGVDATRRLDPEAIARTVAVLSEYRCRMDAAGVTRVRMAATSAVRDAANGQDFLEAAAEVVGAPAQLLSGEDEGALAYAGATADLPGVDGDDVVIDIGGGSTELVVHGPGGLGVVSLDLGCVRLSERHLCQDPPTEAEVQETVATIEAELDRAEQAVPALGDLRPESRLVGVAGTVSTLAMLDQHLGHYARERVHHFTLSAGAVDRWCDILAGEPSIARADRPGMVEGREDVIVGGALVLRQAMWRFGFDECLVSESDILDGLVASIRDGDASGSP